MGMEAQMRGWWVLAAFTLIAGCGSANNMATGSDAEALQVVEAPSEPAAAPGIVADKAEGAAAAVPAPAPRIAYVYSYGYRLAHDRIATAQQAHVALCETLGAARCRVMNLQRSTADGDYSSGSLSLIVDARIARGFGLQLDKAVTDAGGDTADRRVEAEDLSKQMVDTEARIRAKQALADRLMALLQNRGAKVGELVEAERAFAQAQEELDAARSWLAEMRQRVAMSRIEISYASRGPAGGGLWSPIARAFDTAGETFGGSLGAAITFTFIAVPWLLLITALVWLLRKLGWLKRIRWPWPRKKGEIPLSD